MVASFAFECLVLYYCLKSCEKACYPIVCTVTLWYQICVPDCTFVICYGIVQVRDGPLVILFCLMIAITVLDFVNEEAIEDAWVVGAYLSDADLLLTPSSKTWEAENVLQSAAASVAVRGVLFGNTSPLSSRYSS